MSAQLNVNQFALPGMEEHAHAGAKFLAEGKGFRYSRNPVTERYDPGEHSLEMYAPESGRMVRIAHLDWSGSNIDEPDSPVSDAFPGEIKRVGTNRFHRRQGVASALYKMAEDPSVYTGNDTRPLHSPFRTTEGEKWSAGVGGWDPDVHSYGERPLHPYERDARVDQRRPELPGQQELL